MTAIITWIKGKFRLVVEYLLILAVVVIGGFTVSMWIQKTHIQKTLTTTQTNLASVTQRLATQEQVTTTQATTILQLQKQRQIDSDATESLQEDYQVLSDQYSTTRTKLKALEASNAQVRAYTDQPIPTDLQRLLNGQPAAPATGH